MKAAKGVKVMTHDTGAQTSDQRAHGSSSVRVLFIIAKETAAVRYTRWLQVRVVLRKRYFWQRERSPGAGSCLWHDLRLSRVSKNVCDNTTGTTKEGKILLELTDLDRCKRTAREIYGSIMF